MAQPTQYMWSRLAQNVSVDQGNAGDVGVEQFTGVTLVCKLTTLTGGTTPSVTFAIDVKLSDGTYVQIAAGTTLTATGNSIISLGPGMANNHVSGKVIRVRWTVVPARSEEHTSELQ